MGLGFRVHCNGLDAVKLQLVGEALKQLPLLVGRHHLLEGSRFRVWG